MSLQERLDSNGPNRGEVDVLISQRDNIYRQLEYMIECHNFYKEYMRLDIEPDRLHRRLFQETQFTVRSFRNRMTRAGRSFEVIGKMLQSDDYYSEIREDIIQHPDYDNLENGQITEFVTTGDAPSNVNQAEPIVRKAKEHFSDIVEPEKKSAIYRDYHVELFEDCAKHLDKMGDWYESILLEEGLIEDGERGTPSLLALFCLCIVYLTSCLCIIIGYYEEDAFKMMSGCNMLAMGVLAFLAL
ncbi:hypothetical protein JMJ58_18560 [Haloterrigena salifodinae]|uniref:Uncharacterized protein n=1 Tax=Haloterrigena salifodinae TaxID=2675099 RepID=A0A8T8E059_9EURY|nr:hypothetical protein [Haloterrigena salifodinae]QRV14893.1 hypothetical protein JMJ58_18560 [Haloterrigena salifodinae]